MKLLLCALSCHVRHNLPSSPPLCVSPLPDIGPQLGADIQSPLEEALVLTLSSVTTLNDGMKHHEQSAACLTFYTLDKSDLYTGWPSPRKHLQMMSFDLQFCNKPSHYRINAHDLHNDMKILW